MDATGRDSKSGARAKYHFSVQANVVCGPGGVQRFTVVPKNVGTGGNFGLTNLIVALHSAWKAGKIGPHVKKMIRHTDGGPDNVTWVSHMVHFLLVYIGAFEDLLWFMFMAGHSHTEIADRLFALMKKLFESDSGARVRPVQDFVELESRLREVFDKAKEEFEMGYLFANWDFASWFREHEFDPARDFKGYSFDLVFKYTYVGEALWQHGGVQVLYKDRLSYVGTSREAEWKPIQRVMRSRPTMQGSEEAEVNETVSAGVLFVQRPPDLRAEPPREEFVKGDDTHETKEACERICNVRARQLSDASMSFWKALRGVHEQGTHASAVPTMPFTSGAFVFDGCPRPLLPMLKDLVRFPRPLITWDLFKDAPPREFQPPQAPSEEDTTAALGLATDDTTALRDPRRVNHITHLGYTEAAAAKDATDLTLEEWIESFPGRVEKVESGKLYIVRLDEQDGELLLGLVKSDGSILKRQDDDGRPEDCMNALWYRRCGVDPKRCNDKKHFGWSKNPAFEPYKDSKGRITNELPVESFLLEVEDADFTKEGLAHKWDAPKFTHVFLKKLHLLAEKLDLRGTDPSENAAAGSSSRTGATSTATACAAAKAAPSRAEGKRPQTQPLPVATLGAGSARQQPKRAKKE